MITDKLEKFLRAALDPVSGFVSDLGSLPPTENSPRFHTHRAVAKYFLKDHVMTIDSSGTALSKKEARLISLIESLERYCFLLPPSAFQDRIIHQDQTARFSDIVSAESFVSFQPQQLGHPLLGRLEENRKNSRYFISARRFGDADENSLLPLGSVFLDRNLAFFPTTTNGMGAGPSFELASQSALFELIERDALMFAWWTQSKPFEFDSLSLIKTNPNLQEIWMRFHKLQKSIRLRLLPTVLGDYAVTASYLSHDLSQGPFFTMSAAYRPRLEDALARALIELGQVLAGSRNVRKKTWDELADFEQALLNFTDHRSLYALPESEQLLGVFHHSSSGPLLNPDSCSSFSVSDFPLLLKEKGVQMYMVDLTAPELAKTGLKVVKAVSPQMIQLNPSHVSRAIGHPRLQSLGELWSAPHPFP